MVPAGATIRAVGSEASAVGSQRLHRRRLNQSAAAFQSPRTPARCPAGVVALAESVRAKARLTGRVRTRLELIMCARQDRVSLRDMSNADDGAAMTGQKPADERVAQLAATCGSGLARGEDVGYLSLA
jgi:hypothetical protein